MGPYNFSLGQPFGMAGNPYSAQTMMGLLTPAQLMQQAANDQQMAQQIPAEIAKGSNGGTNTANTAFNAGAQQAKQDHIDNKTTMAARDLIGTKQAYQAAQNAGDVQGMYNAHQRAENIRTSARKQGLDLSLYDTNVSLDNANAVYQRAAAANALQGLGTTRHGLTPGLLGYLANEGQARQAAAQAMQSGAVQDAQQGYQPLNQVEIGRAHV